jgi:hypothetical protein
MISIIILPACTRLCNHCKRLEAPQASSPLWAGQVMVPVVYYPHAGSPMTLKYFIAHRWWNKDLGARIK